MIIMTSWRRFREIRSRRAIRGGSKTMINDVDVSDYKADPRPIADIPAEWSTIIATPIIANKTNDYVTKDTKQVNRGE